MKLRGLIKRRGIALFITMVTTVLLALLMGAFFNAYRSHFSLTRASNSSQAASAACDSVFQYIVYRAEHDRGWGSGPFDVSGEGDPRGAILDFSETVGTQDFSGRVYSVDANFEGTVYNNLTGSASTAVAAEAKPGTLKCIVRCKVGDSTRQAEFLVRVAPLFDSSVLTRSDLKVDAERLYMRSRDINRNFLRAEGDIYVPNVISSNDSQFLLPNSNDPDGKGMLWAKGDIYSYDGTGPELIDETDEWVDAAANSNGKLVAQADSHFSIFDLNETNLYLPGEQSEVDVPQGRWNFVRKPAVVNWSATYGSGWGAENHGSDAYAWVDVLEYYSNPEDETPARVYRGRHRTADLQNQIPQDTGGWFPKDLDPDSITTNDVTLVDYDGMDVTIVDDGRLDFPSATNPAERAVFDLNSQTFAVHHNVRVNVDGPFHITSFNDPDADFSAAPDWVKDTPPPTLDLGYAADPDAPGGVAKATLFGAGTINIENGITNGLGSVVSVGGDVRIQPKDTSSLDVSSDDNGAGLLIYAGQDVVLKNPDQTQDWQFKGLVYARDAIEMVGSGAENVTFEGSLVALHESEDEGSGIEFTDCGQIEFVYNSELLDSYVRTLPGNRIQVETVYFKR